MDAIVQVGSFVSSACQQWASRSASMRRARLSPHRSHGSGSPAFSLNDLAASIGRWPRPGNNQDPIRSVFCHPAWKRFDTDQTVRPIPTPRRRPRGSSGCSSAALIAPAYQTTALSAYNCSPSPDRFAASTPAADPGRVRGPSCRPLAHARRERAPFGSTRSCSPEVPPMTKSAVSSAAVFQSQAPPAGRAPVAFGALPNKPEPRESDASKDDRLHRQNHTVNGCRVREDRFDVSEVQSPE